MKSQSSIWDKEYKKRPLWNRQTTSLPELLKGNSVLELGVGNGKTLLSILQQKPKLVTAVDFSSEAITICNKNSLFSSVKFIKSDILSFPFENNSFDVVVCYYTLNALLEKDRQKAIKEIRRVLKPQGILIFEDFAVGDFRQFQSSIKIEPNTIQKPSGIICHFFTKNELTSLFNDFKNIKITQKTFKPFKTQEDITRKIIQAIAYTNT